MSILLLLLLWPLGSLIWYCVEWGGFSIKYRALLLPSLLLLFAGVLLFGDLHSSDSYLVVTTTRRTLAFMWVMFLLLAQICTAKDKTLLEEELLPVQIGYAGLGCLALFSNHVSILVLSLITLFVVCTQAPQLSLRSRARDVTPWAHFWFSSLIILAVLFVGLVLVEFGTLYITQIQSMVLAAPMGPWVHWVLGLFLILILSSNIFLPFSFFLREFEESDSWRIFSYFRVSASMLLLLISVIWVESLAGGWSANGQFEWAKGTVLPDVFFYLSALISVLASFQVLFSKRFSQTFQALAMQVHIPLCWGVLSGVRLAQLSEIYALLSWVLAIGIILFVVVDIDLKPFEEESGVQMALKTATPIHIFAIILGILSLSPMFRIGSFEMLSSGFNKWSPALLVCAALSVMGVMLELSMIFNGYSLRRERINIVGRGGLWGVLFLCLILITLGIYPSPLYKYLSSILVSTT